MEGQDLLQISSVAESCHPCGRCSFELRWKVKKVKSHKVGCVEQAEDISPIVSYRTWPHSVINLRWVVCDAVVTMNLGGPHEKSEARHLYSTVNKLRHRFMTFREVIAFRFQNDMEHS